MVLGVIDEHQIILPATGRRASALGQSRTAGLADIPAMLEVEFLRGEGHLGNRKIAVVRVDVPGIRQGVQVHAVPVFSQILILDVTGVERRHRDLHLEGIPVHIRALHVETVAILHHRALPQVDEALGVG